MRPASRIADRHDVERHVGARGGAQGGERQCACGGILEEIGADLSEQIDYVPAKVQVLRHLRVKYACPGCEQCMKTAALPEHILPKTNASPGLLAHLVTSKYVDSLPLYRLEGQFERHNVR